MPRLRGMTEVFELRQYTLHPGQRDVLITLFNREFVTGQETVGMRVLGVFRDLDDPDRFVWIRGFPDMATRADKLSAFYTGPVWRAHSAEANATMIDSSNVLLLRAAAPDPAFTVPALMVATIYSLPAPADEEFTRFFDDRMLPLLDKTGAPPLVRLCTEYAENNFPALPVRTGEHTFVWFAAFGGVDEYQDHQTRLAHLPEWTDDIAPRLPTTEHLRLAPASAD